MTLKKNLLSVRWIFLLLLLIGGAVSVMAEERLQVVRVKEGFNLQQDLVGWVQNTASYNLYTSPDGVTLRLYTGFDRDFLYLGFVVKDPFLTFRDDYSLDFQGSDHLRVTFFPSGKEREPLTLYLLPTSKIIEPLINISGGSLHRQAVKIHSVLSGNSYFMTVAISLAELEPTLGRGKKLPLQIMLHDLTKSGKVRKLWIFGHDSSGYGTLCF